jgi:anthranilate synthase component 2
MLSSLGETVQVLKNDDAAGWAAVDWELVDRIIVSPGPGHPAEPLDLGLSRAAVDGRARPLLGVCLGHQAIGQAYGGDVIRAKTIMHGKTSRIRHEGKGVFSRLPDAYEATRYHSLVVDRATLPDALEITAWTELEDGSFEEIMGLRHREFPVEGVQFHPESILTEHGHALLKNFLER